MDCGKRRYASKKEAQTVRNWLAEKHNGAKVSVYACPKCRGWHLTHKK